MSVTTDHQTNFDDAVACVEAAYEHAVYTAEMYRLNGLDSADGANAERHMAAALEVAVGA